MKGRSKLLLDNISSGTTEQLIYELFDRTPGVVLSVSICIDTKAQPAKGYAFVEMETDLHAYQAVRDLHGLLVDGQRIAVRLFQKTGQKRRWYDLGAR